jgi:hypothetical protein
MAAISEPRPGAEGAAQVGALATLPTENRKFQHFVGAETLKRTCSFQHTLRQLQTPAPEGKMSSEHAFAAAAGAALMQKAEGRLKALLAEFGVSDPSELSPSEAREILSRAVIEASGANFPSANLKLLAHYARSFAHPAFIPALERVASGAAFPSDAFAMASGVDAAIVLAGFGLPVAPFDRKTPRILAEPSNDIDTVIARFARWQTAYVGYNVCAAPVYVLLTDCVRTLVQKVPVHPELAEVKKLFERRGAALPPAPEQSFIPGMAIFARQLGDTISTTGLVDSSPFAGSVVLIAGWEAGGQVHGAPNDGYHPVPVQLLHAAVNDPGVAYALCRPVGPPPSIH